MKISLREQEGVSILELNGDMIGGEDTLVQTVESLLAQGKRLLVADWGSVHYVNSVGLGQLFNAMRRVREGNGHLVLANLSVRIKNLLTITRLIEVLETVDTVEEGIVTLTATGRHLDHDG